MKKVILIYSGGMDSTVLLYDLIKQGYEVRALGINYGQRHKKELECATKICAELNIEYRIADLSSLKPLLAGSSQTDDTIAVPHGHYSEDSMKVTVVSNRNALMLSCAVAWAISTKSDYAAYAAHAGDHAQYPDCREEFASAFNTVALLADWHQVSLLRPYVTISKADIAQIGKKLNVPFEKTWSCYEGKDIHCGKCGTCVERLEALNKAGVDDKTVYADTEYWKTVTKPQEEELSEQMKGGQY